MRKIFILLLLITLGTAQSSAVEVHGAQWIWQASNGPANSWLSFRKTFDLEKIPETVLATIAVDSKFWLWINGEMVVFEGGQSRGPSQAGSWDRKNKITPSNSWYDEINMKPYLKQGKNTIAILVWYWGRETYKGTHVDSGKGGLLFAVNFGSKTIVSDASWKMKVHPAYNPDSGENSKSIVPYNVKYDAQKDLNDWTSSAWYSGSYSDESWESAVEKGTPPVAPWYNLEKNNVPLLVNHGLKEYENYSLDKFPFVSEDEVISCDLPFNMQITPYMEIESKGGELIEIYTDNPKNAVKAFYTTKEGLQGFECYSWMNGHSVKYKIPAGVKVVGLKYRWMSVGQMAGSFETSDPFYQRLWWMGRNTLFVCARDNFMDCPDRERAQWIGDIADQAGYLFYAMDNSGRKLLEKSIRVTMAYSENKVFGALGPLRVRELPSQSLQFISQGVWQYYFNTADTATLRYAYPYIHDYLGLWELQSGGLPKYRKGASPDSWDWSDWGKDGTIDKEPIQYALYYIALNSAKKMAFMLGKTEHVAWYENRIKSIRNSFNSAYWTGNFYSSDSTKFQDDRANALTILAGLADSSKYDRIVKNVLIPNKFCSPHFEWMVEEAMCVAGKYSESLDRMKEQYQSQVSNLKLTTLYENFPKGGSYNHAWNAPNTILSKYIAGIVPTKVGWSEYHILPNLVHLTSVNVVVPSVKGDITVDIRQQDGYFQMDLISPQETTAIVGIPKLNNPVSIIKVNNKIVWKKGVFKSGLKEISWNDEDDKYIKFNVLPGVWYFSTY